MRRRVARLGDDVRTIAQVVEVAIRPATAIQLVVPRAPLQGVGGALVPVRRVVAVISASGCEGVVARAAIQGVAASAPRQPIIARVTIENVVLVVQAGQAVIARRAIDDQTIRMQLGPVPCCAVRKHHLLDPRGDVAIPALHRDLVTRVGKAQHQVLPGARYRHVRRRYPGAQYDPVRTNVLHPPVLHRDVARLVEGVRTIAQVVQVGVRSPTTIQLVITRTALQCVGGDFVVVRRVVRAPLASANQCVVTRSSTQVVTPTTA